MNLTAPKDAIVKFAVFEKNLTIQKLCLQGPLIKAYCIIGKSSSLELGCSLKF